VIDWRTPRSKPRPGPRGKRSWFLSCKRNKQRLSLRRHCAGSFPGPESYLQVYSWGGFGEQEGDAPDVVVWISTGFR